MYRTFVMNTDKIDMFYMYVIPGFNIINYESQSNFVVQNIKSLFFKICKPSELTLFIFDPPF